MPVVPGESAPSIELLLESESPRSATLRSGNQELAVSLGPRPTWCRVPKGAAPLDVVNSAGAMLTADGYGADRGYLEPDDGRFDEPTDVFAWSGATVLLSAPYLRDVGVLDERLFLYYEDLELSWRGQARLALSIYTGIGRPPRPFSDDRRALASARYQNERNRLLVLARHGDRSRCSSCHEHAHCSLRPRTRRRDIVSPMLRGTRPRATIVADRVRAFGGYSRRLPAMLRDRRASRDPRTPGR